MIDRPRFRIQVTRLETMQLVGINKIVIGFFFLMCLDSRAVVSRENKKDRILDFRIRPIRSKAARKHQARQA